MKFQIFILFLLLKSFIFSQSLVINEIVSSNSIYLDEDGDTPDWIEIFNPTSEIVNLQNYSISDDVDELRKWIFPSFDLGPSEYLIVFASDKDKFTTELHTNFKISSSGEDIFLVDNYGFIVDHLEAKEIPADYSLGRSIENELEWLIFPEPTPMGSNSTEGYIAMTEQPTFSVEGGFYASNIDITLSTLSDSADIFYTTDGSNPTKNSTQYDNPIQISNTKVIRAIAFEGELLPSKIITHTYFINENPTLPVISLSTNSDNFFDSNIGIYVIGNNGIPGNCLDYPANWNQDWERPIHIEFYEKDGELGFSIDAGVKIHGGCSRIFDLKSLQINARGEYGSPSIPYKIFDDLPYEEYNSIILRNSGNDYNRTFIRDAVTHQVAKNLDIDLMAYKPVIVYLNGEYWGIHNLRERTNNNYIEQHHDVDKSNLDILRDTHLVIQGDRIDYDNLINFFKNHNISVAENYDYVKSKMELDNYIDYMLVEMYVVNKDWFPPNMKYWKTKTTDGMWRWVLFDADVAFGLYDETSYDENMFTTVKNEDKYPSHIFNGLIENDQFVIKFLNSFADKANTIFKPNEVIEIIDSIKTMIETEMPRHISRWSFPSSISVWETKIQVIRNFANQRLQYMKEDFINEFDLEGMSSVNLNIDDKVGGCIQINSLLINDTVWSGDYFIGIPLQLEALPKPGYSFVGWSGSITSSDKVIVYTPTSLNNITAKFQKNPPPPEIVINEINYNSNDNFESGDWIELYNKTSESVNISNWYFVDEESVDDHKFTIQEGTIIESNEYLVLAEDQTSFSSIFPDVHNVMGDFGSGEYGFGLSGGGEAIRLYSNDHQLVDSVEYDDKSPWPEEADGDGPTLELINPNLNNLLPENWSVSLNIGTPGMINDSYTPGKNLELILKVILEGCYNTDDNLMVANLNQGTSLPVLQPYSGPPWNYDGTENVEDIPNNDIVDWILVELKNKNNQSLIRKAGFLKNNGSIVDIDGSSNMIFENLEDGEYLVIIKHRNHLSVIANQSIMVE